MTSAVAVFLTAIVGQELGGRVDSHLAEGAVEETNSFLFFRLLFWSLRLDIFLCFFLGARRQGGVRRRCHSFRGATARCRLF